MIKKLNKTPHILFILLATFSSGIILGMMAGKGLPAQENTESYLRVTGIDGIFFKAEDPVALKVW